MNLYILKSTDANGYPRIESRFIAVNNNEKYEGCVFDNIYIYDDKEASIEYEFEHRCLSY
jgi:hypothetical protein